jgi:hypothetical protein
LLLVGACSASHHPPELGDEPPAHFDAGSGDSSGAQGNGAPDARSDAPDSGSDAPTAPGLSNQCTKGTISLTSDTLNPGDVYLVGTLMEGACGYDALTHWSDPGHACVGFDCSYQGEYSVIRPTDGRLIYTRNLESEMREFHADACGVPTTNAYPSNPLANDTLLPSTCPNNGGFDVFNAFLVTADGDVYYKCGHVWYTLAGTKVYDETGGVNNELRWVSHDHVALVGNARLGLVNLVAGTVIDIPPSVLPASDLVAVRARDAGGFWLAVTNSVAEVDVELRQLTPDGTMTPVGKYPPLPAAVHSVFGSTLDGCGALLQKGTGTVGLDDDLIVRREINGASQVVYDEANNPLVRMDSSYLVTGP